MFQSLLKTIAQSLDEREIQYMIVGGQAVLLYGEPRFTKDIDITLGVDSNCIDDILTIAKEKHWKILVENPHTFVRETMVLPCLEPESDIRLDFMFSYSEYEKAALQRVHRERIGDIDVCYASLEDLIVHKLIASRPRDIEDIKSIMLKNAEIDRTYILNWLEEFERALDISLSSHFLALWRETRKPT